MNRMQARAAALHLLAGSQGSRLINMYPNDPACDDPVDDSAWHDDDPGDPGDPGDPDDEPVCDVYGDPWDDPDNEPGCPEPVSPESLAATAAIIIPFPRSSVAEKPVELDAEELIARLRSLPMDRMVEFAQANARRIDLLSRQALPAGGGRRHTEAWIPLAPVHALFERVGRFPIHNKPPVTVSRSFMRLFRDARVTASHLVILAQDPDTFNRCRPTLSEAGDVGRWFRLLWEGTPETDQPGLRQVLASERTQLATRCLTLDPDEFGGPLAQGAGVKVDVELAGIRDGHHCGVRLHWQDKLNELRQMNSVPEFCEMDGARWFNATLFVKNCAVEWCLRIQDETGLLTSRPVMLISDPEERASVIRHLAADHNLRHDVFHLLGNDVFGISRPEIEREVEQQRASARKDLEFYFGDSWGADVGVDESMDGDEEIDDDIEPGEQRLRPMEGARVA